MRFIISVFGEKHIGMLLTCLYSITHSNPDEKISVYWEDIDLNLLQPIMTGFNKVDFIKTDFQFQKDPVKRISSKVNIWHMAAKNSIGDNICLLDADTLVLKSISHFFKDYSEDIMFTHKPDEQFPINTGVILCRNTEHTISFFDLWRDETIKIINTPELFSIANSINHHYGGADQMSICSIFEYEKQKKRYDIRINNDMLTIKPIHCKVLNETNSTQITEQTHIIHYKGGWQPVLLEGMNFTKDRTRDNSKDMYLLYLNTYKKAVEYVNDLLNKKYSLSFFRIIVPFYMNEDLSEKMIYYWIYYLNASINTMIRINISRLNKVINMIKKLRR